MNDLVFMGAALAVWLAGLGVGVGQGILAQKSIEVFGKNPKLGNTVLLYTILGIALIESAAIYGLVIAVSILGAEGLTGFQSIAAGLAIGLAGLGAGIGEGKLVSGAMDAIYRNPESKGRTLIFMVLFLALVEAVAIYGLVIANTILGS